MELDNETNIESFSFDHTAVSHVPFVRMAKDIRLVSGSTPCWTVKKFDIRLVVPNSGKIPSKVLHTLEHILSIELSNYFSDYKDIEYIDFSPMGCKTGFYLTMAFSSMAFSGEFNSTDVLYFVKEVVNHCFGMVRQYDSVPFANKFQCGNYKLFDLSKTKKMVSDFWYSKFEIFENV